MRDIELPRKGIVLPSEKRLWKPLTKDEVDRFAVESVRVIEDVGTCIENVDLLKVAESNGCEVEYDKKIVHFPSHVVNEFIKKAPKNFSLAGRREEDDILFDGHTAYGCFSTAMPKICLWDGNSNEYVYREATEADLMKAVRLYDSLEHVDVVMPPTLAMDAAKRGLASSVHELSATLTETTRHVNLCNAAPGSSDEWDYFARLAAEVVGGEEELRKRPIISSMSLYTPPLMLSQPACFNMLGATKHGFPLLLGGANSPLTILNACNVVVNHASALANLTLAQMLSPGTPCVINIWGASLDVRHVTTNFAAPENQLLNAVLIQMVHGHMGIPVNYSPNTAAKVPDDIQAAFEIALCMNLQWITGCDLWTNYTFNDDAFSPEMLVFQDELAGYFNHLGKRFSDTTPSEESIAFEAIKKIGATGNYFTHKITLDNIPLQYNPSLIDYRSVANWSKDKRVMLDRIRDRVRLLEQRVPKRLPNDVLERMNAIVAEADHKLRK